MFQDIAALEDDRETHLEKHDAIKKDLGVAEEMVHRVTEEEREARESLGRAEEKCQSYVDQVEQLNKDLSECEEGIRKSRRDQDHYVAKKAEYASKAGEKTVVMEAKSVELDAALTRAKEQQASKTYAYLYYRNIQVQNFVTYRSLKIIICYLLIASPIFIL